MQVTIRSYPARYESEVLLATVDTKNGPIKSRRFSADQTALADPATGHPSFRRAESLALARGLMPYSRTVAYTIEITD